MRKQLLLGVAVLSALTLAGTAVAHEATYDSTITVHYANDEFAGQVNSTNDKCEAGRTVKVFLVEGEEKTLVASGTTAEDGSYSIAYEDAAEGDYYARVTREVLRNTSEHSHVCAADKSPTIPVSDPGPPA